MLLKVFISDHRLEWKWFGLNQTKSWDKMCLMFQNRSRELNLRTVLIRTEVQRVCRTEYSNFTYTAYNNILLWVIASDWRGEKLNLHQNYQKLWLKEQSVGFSGGLVADCAPSPHPVIKRRHYMDHIVLFLLLFSEHCLWFGAGQVAHSGFTRAATKGTKTMS